MQRKIKICFILSHLPQGGAERQTINLIRMLDPACFETTMLLYANNEIFYDEIHKLPVRIISKPSFSSNKILKNLSGAVLLRRVLSNNDFDILHTMLFHNGLWVRLLAPRRYNHRIIYSIRSSLDGLSLIERHIEKLFAKRSFAVANSVSVMEQYKKITNIGDSYIARIIYNGIEIDRFKSNQPPILNNTIIIGTVGRQTAKKNQIQILRVVKELCEHIPVHLFIIGDSDKENFSVNHNYIKDNHLSEYITIMDSQKNIEQYYSKFNIFVLPSLSESCPNVLFEAMLAKCLCIVSRGANSDQFIHDGNNGFVYDGTDQMLKEKLGIAIDILRSGNEAVILENAQNYVLENFSIDKMLNSYLELYGNLMQEER